MRLLLHTLLSGYRGAMIALAMLLYLPTILSRSLREWRAHVRDANIRPLSVRRRILLFLYPLHCQLWIFSRIPLLAGWDVELNRIELQKKLQSVSTANSKPTEILAVRLEAVCTNFLNAQFEEVFGFEWREERDLVSAMCLAGISPATLKQLRAQCGILGLGWIRQKERVAFNLDSLRARYARRDKASLSHVSIRAQIASPYMVTTMLYKTRELVAETLTPTGKGEFFADQLNPSQICDLKGVLESERILFSLRKSEECSLVN